MLDTLFSNLFKEAHSMKKCFSLLLFSLFIKVAAYANPECPSYAIPYPAVCESCYNTYGFVEFLYWKAHEDGLGWAASQTANFALPASPTTAEPHWLWRPGFRVGLGHLLCDGWDLSLAYTWYRSHAVDSETFNPNTNIAFGLFDTNASAGGHSSWCLNYNTLDLALKKPFFIGERVILSPSLALFGAYTSERYIIDNIQPGGPPFSSNHISNKQKLFCIGPKAGLNSIWHLTNCWSIFGEGSIAFLWAHYHISRLDINNNGDTGVSSIFANLKNKFDTIRLVPFYTIGIKWNKPICNGSYCLHFKATWEQQVWLQHNQLFLLSVSNDNTLLFNNTNLSLYGLTLGAGVQF